MLQDGLATIRQAGFNVGTYAALKDSPKTCAELKVIGRVTLDVVYSGKQRALPKPWLTASPAEAPRFGYVTLVKVVAKVPTGHHSAVDYVRSKKEVRGKKGFPRYYQPYDCKEDRYVALSVEEFVEQYRGIRPGPSRKHSARASLRRSIK